MRTIKFRAWDKNTNKMVGWHDIASKVMFYDWFTDENHLIMQYTGLKDKNGKEIYEGDIIKTTTGGYKNAIGGRAPIRKRIRSVEFNEGAFTFSDTPSVVMYSGDSVEIIGNIYDNPKLI